jgi:hypothetical protein
LNARRADAFLDFVQRALQLLEVFRCTQFGIVLGRGHDRRHALADLVVQMHARARVEIAAHRLRAQVGDRLERLLFVLRIALDHGNEIRDQVVAHLQHRIDAGKRVRHGVAPNHEQVPHEDRRDHERGGNE